MSTDPAPNWIVDEDVTMTWLIARYWTNTIPLVMTGRAGTRDFPLVTVLVPPASTIDFSDPAEGFSADRHSPLVATVYSNEAVSIRHSDRWRFVIDAADGDLGEALLASLDRPDPYMVLLVTFDEIPTGAVNMAEYFRTLPSSVVPIEDRRPRRRRAKRGR